MGPFEQEQLLLCFPFRHPVGRLGISLKWLPYCLQRRTCVTTNLVKASTSRAKVTVKFCVGYLWDLPASSLLFSGPISAIRPVVFVEWEREKGSLTWKHPAAPHCLAGIGNPSVFSHPTPQPHPGCSSPCLSPHILHPLNNLQALSSGALFRLFSLSALSTPLLSRMKSGSNSPLVCPLSLWALGIRCSTVTCLNPLYSARLPAD